MIKKIFKYIYKYDTKLGLFSLLMIMLLITTYIFYLCNSSDTIFLLIGGTIAILYHIFIGIGKKYRWY